MNTKKPRSLLCKYTIVNEAFLLSILERN